MRQLLMNGITDNKATKKKKQSSSKSKVEKRKRKKSSEGSTEKLKVKQRRRSGSKSDKSVKKRRRGLEKSLEKSLESLIPKVKQERVSDGDVALKVNANNVDEKSPNSEEYHSNWDSWDEMTGSSVPKQDRTAIFMNDTSSKIAEQFNQTTPRMDRGDPTVETPIIVDVSVVNCQQPVSENVENGILKTPPKLCASGDALENCISKITPKEPSRKKIEPPKSNHQPIAQLYDEYEQFIMSCMRASSDETKQNNGDKSSVTSSLYDETVTSNDGDEELEALKMSLEKKLHDIEHTDSEDATKVKVLDQSIIQSVKTISAEPSSIITKESSDSSSSSSSSSSSDSSSSSTSSPSHKKQRKKKVRKQNAESKLTLSLNETIFSLKTGIEDDELSDNELLSKVELLKQQFSEKRKALANKRKLVSNDSESPETGTKTEDILLVSSEKRSAISLKIGSNKPNSIRKPVMFDDDDFTETLLLEVTPNTLARSKQTNKLLIERVIEPGVGLVSSSNCNSLACEIINTKVTRIGRMPNNPIFPQSNKSMAIENAVVKIRLNESVPIDKTEMKNYLNNTHLDGSESITSKTSGLIDSNVSRDLSPASIRKGSPTTRHLTPPHRSDKRDSCDFNSKGRPLSPHHRSRTKESSKRYSSPQPLRHRSPRPRKRSSHRSPSPNRKRSRGSPRRSRSPRKSPRRRSPRRLRRSLSPRSKRIVSPLGGRPRTPPEKHSNRKWEPPLTTDYANSTKNALACDNNVPQPICRLESTHSTPWPDQGNSAFAQYGYQHIHPLSPKRSLDDRISHSFNHSDQSYDFHQASDPYMGHIQYSNENTSKIPVLNSHENYYFQPHLAPQNMRALQPQSIPPQHVPRLSVPPMQHVPHIAPNQLSTQPLSVQHATPLQRTFPNLIEIRQSNVDEDRMDRVDRVDRIPFVLKGNVLEIVPKTETIDVEPLLDYASTKVEDESDVKVELTEEEIERREIKKAELKLKRKQERDKRHLERFMRKEKLKLEIKHLMEVGVHTEEIKKATYNPNAVRGKIILRINTSSFSERKKNVLFADGVAPGDGTSTSGGEDVVPLLRDRNKRMTKKKLDSKRRRARREASVNQKEAAPQVLEITPFIDPELETMAPPLPPDGIPPARLVQPKLKSTPKLIYFHYDPRSNAMYVSPFPTDVHIPSYPSIDSPTASTTPDLIQKPKVFFIQPPAFEPSQLQVANQSLPNTIQNASMQNNSVCSTDLPTPSLPMKQLNQQHQQQQQQPSTNSLPTSPAVYPSMQTHSLSPQNYRGPVAINNHQSVVLQPSPIPIQSSPMASQWENSAFQTNKPIPAIQHPPCVQSWEPDTYPPPHNQSIRPHTRFNNVNNIVQPRPPVHNQWDQQRHPNPIFQNPVHSPQQQQPPAFHARPNHPRFHQNPPINVSAPHQPHNNFAFNANYNYNANQSWNNQYRNNH